MRRPIVAAALTAAVVLGGSAWTARQIESDLRARTTTAVHRVNPGVRVQLSGRDVLLTSDRATLTTLDPEVQAAAAVPGVRRVTLDGERAGAVRLEGAHP